MSVDPVLNKKVKFLSFLRQFFNTKKSSSNLNLEEITSITNMIMNRQTDNRIPQKEGKKFTMKAIKVPPRKCIVFLVTQIGKAEFFIINNVISKKNPKIPERIAK